MTNAQIHSHALAISSFDTTRGSNVYVFRKNTGAKLFSLTLQENNVKHDSKFCPYGKVYLVTITK